MHVNQVRLAEKTDSISWEEQPSEWTAADIQKAAIHFRVSSFMVEERIHQYSGVMFLLNPKDYR